MELPRRYAPLFKKRRWTPTVFVVGPRRMAVRARSMAAIARAFRGGLPQLLSAHTQWYRAVDWLSAVQ